VLETLKSRRSYVLKEDISEESFEHTNNDTWNSVNTRHFENTFVIIPESAVFRMIKPTRDGSNMITRPYRPLTDRFIHWVGCYWIPRMLSCKIMDMILMNGIDGIGNLMHMDLLALPPTFEEPMEID